MRRRLRRLSPDVIERAINLTFHGVGATDRRLDDGEAAVWVGTERFHAVLDAVRDRDDVRITFDDGNASDLEHGLPALLERGMTGTFFVVAGRLDEPGYLSAADVRALAGAGMTIGSHGMRHRPWRGLGDAALDEELVAAKAALEQVLGVPVTEAACPFGAYDRRVLAGLRRAGFRRVYTSDRGAARRDDWIQARTTIHAGDDGETVQRVLTPRDSLRRRAKLTAKRWR